MINTVTLQGRLTADPEVKRTDSDIAVCNFSIACDRSYTKEEKITDFFDCVAWRKKAEFLERNFGKGDMIAITGKLFTEIYTDKNGSSHKAVKILVSDISYSGMTKKQREAASSADTKTDTNRKDIPEGLESIIDFDYSDDLSDDEDLPF